MPESFFVLIALAIFIVVWIIGILISIASFSISKRIVKRSFLLIWISGFIIGIILGILFINSRFCYSYCVISAYVGFISGFSMITGSMAQTITTIIKSTENNIYRER